MVSVMDLGLPVIILENVSSTESKVKMMDSEHTVDIKESTFT